MQLSFDLWSINSVIFSTIFRHFKANTCRNFELEEHFCWVRLKICWVRSRFCPHFARLLELQVWQIIWVRWSSGWHEAVRATSISSGRCMRPIARWLLWNWIILWSASPDSSGFCFSTGSTSQKICFYSQKSVRMQTDRKMPRLKSFSYYFSLKAETFQIYF